MGHSLVIVGLLFSTLPPMHLWQQLPDHFHCCLVFCFGDITQDFGNHSFSSLADAAIYPCHPPAVLSICSTSVGHQDVEDGTVLGLICICLEVRESSPFQKLIGDLDISWNVRNASTVT